MIEWYKFGSSFFTFFPYENTAEQKFNLNRSIFYYNTLPLQDWKDDADVFSKMFEYSTTSRVSGCLHKSAGDKKKIKQSLKLGKCLVLEMVYLSCRKPLRNTRKKIHEKYHYSPQHKLSISHSFYLLACCLSSQIFFNAKKIHYFRQVSLFLVFAVIDILKPVRLQLGFLKKNKQT